MYSTYPLGPVSQLTCEQYEPNDTREPLTFLAPPALTTTPGITSSLGSSDGARTLIQTKNSRSRCTPFSAVVRSRVAKELGASLRVEQTTRLDVPHPVWWRRVSELRRSQ
jgi:hypothetical protein